MEKSADNNKTNKIKLSEIERKEIIINKNSNILFIKDFFRRYLIKMVLLLKLLLEYWINTGIILYFLNDLIKENIIKTGTNGNKIWKSIVIFKCSLATA